jgi:hypothetical protein
VRVYLIEDRILSVSFPGLCPRPRSDSFVGTFDVLRALGGAAVRCGGGIGRKIGIFSRFRAKNLYAPGCNKSFFAWIAVRCKLYFPNWEKNGMNSSMQGVTGKRKVTAREVAVEAGVSKWTVNRAFKKDGNCPGSPFCRGKFYMHWTQNYGLPTS